MPSIFLRPGEANPTTIKLRDPTQSDVGAITGTLAVTEVDDALSAAAVALISGALVIAEAADTLSATAVAIVFGASTLTEGADTLGAAGVVAIAGSASPVDADDGLVASGALLVQASGALAEDADASAATAAVAISGATSAAEADDALTASGTVADAGSVTGDAAITEVDDLLAADAIATQPVPESRGGGYGFSRGHALKPVPRIPPLKAPRPRVGELDLAEEGDGIFATGTVGIRGRAAREAEMLLLAA